ncbi:hypothetical protein [Agromyces sp. NPDC055658]
MIFAALSFVVGVVAFIVALNAPLVDDLARTVWIAGFGAVAVWAGGMAIARIRQVGRGPKFLARFGIAVGIATIAVMGYALVAISIGPSGSALPAMAQWTGGTAPSVEEAAPEYANLEDDPPGSVAGTSELPPPPREERVSSLEAERLALSQSLGTAAYVLQETASSDGTWPASLLVTTDASAVMSPDGVILASMPAGTQVIYSTSSDRLKYSLTLIGPSGAIATYVSTSGVIQTNLQ